LEIITVYKRTHEFLFSLGCTATIATNALTVEAVALSQHLSDFQLLEPRPDARRVGQTAYLVVYHGKAYALPQKLYNFIEKLIKESHTSL
jgi:hypothetical protein